MNCRFACELPIVDRRLLETARNSKVRAVLLGDGKAEPTRGSDPGVYSASALALEMDERLLLVAADSVDVGPRAEAFRLRIFDESASFTVAMRDGLARPASCPSDLDLTSVTGSTFQPALVRFNNPMSVEITPGKEQRIEMLTDSGLILLGSSGAVLLIEHDHEMSLNLRITTSPKSIGGALGRAVELAVI